jgi:hypothetical protein
MVLGFVDMLTCSAMVLLLEAAMTQGDVVVD